MLYYNMGDPKDLVEGGLRHWVRPTIVVMCAYVCIICLSISLYMYICMCICTYIYIYIHMCICVHIYIYICTYRSRLRAAAARAPRDGWLLRPQNEHYPRDQNPEVRKQETTGDNVFRICLLCSKRKGLWVWVFFVVLTGKGLTTGHPRCSGAPPRDDRAVCHRACRCFGSTSHRGDSQARRHRRVTWAGEFHIKPSW